MLAKYVRRAESVGALHTRTESHSTCSRLTHSQSPALCVLPSSSAPGELVVSNPSATWPMSEDAGALCSELDTPRMTASVWSLDQAAWTNISPHADH